MIKKIIIYVCLLLSSFSTYSQIAIPHRVDNPKPADSIDISYYSPKNGILAAGMCFGLNIGVWAFDRYVLKADYAYINVRTMKNNLKKGFIWDNDFMGTNMFLHPYHGSLYFNAARSNGYNYWQSGLFALAGSTMWELFMECEYPSTNDILATPIGGMALGEMFYRMSDLVLDDRKSGKSRFGLEAVSFIISPMRGLTRIINGDAWKVRYTSGRQFGIPEVSFEVAAGLRILELKDEIFDQGLGIATEIHVEYGERFNTDQNKPYDYFYFNANLNIQASQPFLGQINLVGRLLGTELINNKKHYLNLGLYQHFDYYDSDTISDISSKVPYKFCTPASLGIGAMYKSKLLKNWEINSYTHLNGIILGGTLSDYYLVEDRNYNLASGFNAKSGFNLIYQKDKLAISTIYEFYRMFTWKGYPYDMDWNDFDSKTLNAQGDNSQATLHVAGIRTNIKLRNQLYITGSLFNYIRHTNYKYFSKVSSKTFEGKILLTYKF